MNFPIGNFNGVFIHNGVLSIQNPNGVSTLHLSPTTGLVINVSTTFNQSVIMPSITIIKDPLCNTKYGFDTLKAIVTGERNTAIGENALKSIIIGDDCTAVGYNALCNNVTDELTAIGSNALAVGGGGECTAVGYYALNATLAGENTAVGWRSLEANNTGTLNVAVGNKSLQANTGGQCNVAVGSSALLKNTTGNQNVGVGGSALNENKTGVDNIAIGTFAGRYNEVGDKNIAIGVQALQGNALTAGFNITDNIAVGYQSCFKINTLAGGNVCVGVQSLFELTTGSDNTGLGYQTGSGITTGSRNTHIGVTSAGGSGAVVEANNKNNTILIANKGTSLVSNEIRIGNATDHTKCSIAGINGVTTGTADALPVVMDSTGQLGTGTPSSFTLLANSDLVLTLTGAALSGTTFVISSTINATRTITMPALSSGLGFKFLVRSLPTGTVVITFPTNTLTVLQFVTQSGDGDGVCLTAQDTITIQVTAVFKGDTIECFSDGMDWYAKIFCCDKDGYAIAT